MFCRPPLVLRHRSGLLPPLFVMPRMSASDNSCAHHLALLIAGGGRKPDRRHRPHPLRSIAFMSSFDFCLTASYGALSAGSGRERSCRHPKPSRMTVRTVLAEFGGSADALVMALRRRTTFCAQLGFFVESRARIRSAGPFSLCAFGKGGSATSNGAFLACTVHQNDGFFFGRKASLYRTRVTGQWFFHPEARGAGTAGGTGRRRAKTPRAARKRGLVRLWHARVRSCLGITHSYGMAQSRIIFHDFPFPPRYSNSIRPCYPGHETCAKPSSPFIKRARLLAHALHTQVAMHEESRRPCRDSARATTSGACCADSRVIREAWGSRAHGVRRRR